MKYLNKTFTVGGHSKEYAENYDRIFGKKGICKVCVSRNACVIANDHIAKCVYFAEDYKPR